MKEWHSNLPEDSPIEVLVNTPNCACARDYEELIFHHHATLCNVAHGFPIRERTALPPSRILATRKPASSDRPPPEALRADLSVPSRTRWRLCESARPSKSPGRSTNHPENRCTIGAHDTVEFESPLQAAPKSGAPSPSQSAASGGSSPKSRCFRRMSIVSKPRTPSEQFRTCPFC
jgi:hypothetical protein